LPQSRKLIIPAGSYTVNFNEYVFDVDFEGFLMYNIDLKTGAAYAGNVSSTSFHQSMVFDGDLITFTRDSINRTSIENFEH